jgi:PKD repeat protein
MEYAQILLNRYGDYYLYKPQKQTLFSENNKINNIPYLAPGGIMKKLSKLHLLICGLKLLSTSICSAQISFNDFTIASPFAGARAVFAADVNNDGFMDVVGGGNYDKIAWFENDGNQNFTEHEIYKNSGLIRSIWAEDMNGDGKIDILAASWTNNRVDWWENLGEGSFVQHIVDSTFTGAHTIEACDVNQDGFMDILCCEFDVSNQSDIAWWENDGQQNFTKHIISGRFKRSPFIHGNDIDSDGDVDILACGETLGDVLWWENDGNENFTEHMIDANYTAAHTVFARDLDQDGDKDILGAACLSHQYTWWENDGSQNFTKHPVDAVTCALWTDMADLDMDGDNDLFGTGTNGAFWWENDGSQNFTQHQLPGEFGDGYCLVSTDIDNDQDIDLVGAGSSVSKIMYWENSLYKFHFNGNPLSGHAPLTVQFADSSRSIQTINFWAWDFDNDVIIDSNEKNPYWTYETPGTYSVTLNVSSQLFSKKLTSNNYIHVFDGESALLFNGKTSYVSIPSEPSLNLTEQFTIEAKIKPSSWGEVNSVGFGRIIDKTKLSLYLIDSSPAFDNHSLALQMHHEDGTMSNTTSQENSISIDTWQHIAVTYEGTTSQARMYVNGDEQIISNTQSPSGSVADNSSFDLLIGNNPTQMFSFDGIIDGIRIWNIVRTKTQIQDNINQYLNGNESGLIGYWDMNEGNGDSINDNSNNISGELVEANWIQGAPFNLPTSIEQNQSTVRIPKDIELYDNYPNPFNPTTTIKFSLPANALVKLQIFNTTGKLVHTLISENKDAGLYSLDWDGKDQFGNKVGSGIYIYRMETNSFSLSKKMLLIK